MSASLKTTNYELGIYAPNDVTSWLTDFNGNMNKIDAQMKANANGVQGNAGEIAALQGKMTTVENDIEELGNEYNNLLQQVAIKSLSASPSTNMTSLEFDVYKFSNLITGNFAGDINKTGDNLSTITDSSSEDYKFIPIGTLVGNPFELDIVTSPNPTNVTRLSGMIYIFTEGSTVNVQVSALRAYYNGTNTIMMFRISSPVLINTNFFRSVISTVTYLLP